jgi:hypothetical protein
MADAVNRARRAPVADSDQRPQTVAAIPVAALAEVAIPEVTPAEVATPEAVVTIGQPQAALEGQTTAAGPAVVAPTDPRSAEPTPTAVRAAVVAQAAVAVRTAVAARRGTAAPIATAAQKATAANTAAAARTGVSNPARTSCDWMYLTLLPLTS